MDAQSLKEQLSPNDIITLLNELGAEPYEQNGQINVDVDLKCSINRNERNNDLMPFYTVLPWITYMGYKYILNE